MISVLKKKIILIRNIHLLNSLATKGGRMEENLNNFCDFVRNLLVEHNITLDVEHGKRYVKLVKNRDGNRSVWGFVDKTTGDILKAASWKAPAKHARGNISDVNSYQEHQWTGPYYLR